MNKPDYAALERLLAELEWQDIETAPRDGRTWVEVGRRSDASPSGWWVATAILHPPSDDGHWTDGDTIVHYNGNALVPGFRGPLTHWRPLRPASRTALLALLEERRQMRAMAERLARALDHLVSEFECERVSPRTLARAHCFIGNARSAGLIETAKE